MNTIDGYTFAEPVKLSDDDLTALYESNGLFARVIDTPAEEATRRPPVLRSSQDRAAVQLFSEGLDALEWDTQALTAVRWARLFGGSIAVILIDDGGRLEDPLKPERVRSIDAMRVYPRAQVQTDFSQDGKPERFHVSSMYGSFTVHESRCLTFHNETAPELSASTAFRFWGIPEYYRIGEAVQRAALASEQTVKLLDISAQAVYRARGLADRLTTEDGEAQVLRRVAILDAARSVLSMIAIDAENEDFSFIAADFLGKGEAVEIALLYLAAVAHIPPEILYGYRSPHWWRNSSPAAQENYYNHVSGIQHRMLKANAERLAAVILRAGSAAGELRQIPPPVIDFPPLWLESASEKATAALSRATTQLTRAKTIQTYMEAGAVVRQDVRSLLRRLKKSERNT